MKLYHATWSELAIGEVLKASARELSFFDDEYRRHAEKFLEDRRPLRLPSRLSSWYACDKPELAAKYLLGEELVHPATHKAQRHLYAVEMNDVSRHPMVLVNQIAKRLAELEQEAAAVLADEYWTPTMDWKFWEYLCPELRVLAKGDWPNTIQLAVATMTYEGEQTRYKAFLSKAGLTA